MVDDPSENNLECTTSTNCAFIILLLRATKEGINRVILNYVLTTFAWSSCLRISLKIYWRPWTSELFMMIGSLDCSDDNNKQKDISHTWPGQDIFSGDLISSPASLSSSQHQNRVNTTCNLLVSLPTEWNKDVGENNFHFIDLHCVYGM